MSESPPQQRARARPKPRLNLKKPTSGNDALRPSSASHSPLPPGSASPLAGPSSPFPSSCNTINQPKTSSSSTSTHSGTPPVPRRSGRPTTSGYKSLSSQEPRDLAAADKKAIDLTDDSGYNDYSKELARKRKEREAEEAREREERERAWAEEEEECRRLEMRPRGVPSKNAKGKGRAVADRESSPIEEDSASEAGESGGSGEEFGLAGSSKRGKGKGRGPARGGGKKKIRMDTEWLKKVAGKPKRRPSYSGSSDSDSDYDGPPRRRKQKPNNSQPNSSNNSDSDGDKPTPALVRERSNSLTPPPALDQEKLLRIEAMVRKNAAAESENPLIASSTNHPERSALAEPSSSRARKEPSPDPNINREKVKLMVWTKFHFPLSASNANAARIFEKKRQITVFRTDSLEELFEAVGRRAGYGEAQLVMTLDGNRVYKSTTPETLGIYDGAELVGYRADIYAAERDALARQKQARMATFAATAQAQADLRAAEDEAKAREREAKVRERIEANKLARAGGGTGEINLDSDDDEWGGGAGAEGKGGGGSDSDDSDIVPLPSKTSTVASSSRLKSTSIKPPSLSPSPPPPAAATQSAQSASAATGEVLRLTLRSSKPPDVKVTVKPTNKISGLLKHFATKRGLSDAERSKLGIEVDGEVLDEGMTVGECEEIEDGDCLMVVGE